MVSSYCSQNLRESTIGHILENEVVLQQHWVSIKADYEIPRDKKATKTKKNLEGSVAEANTEPIMHSLQHTETFEGHYHYHYKQV